jgi:hypothetical protein
MAYTTSKARRELLDTVAQAVNELGFASACLAEAYERLDDYNGDRLEAEYFRPVHMAYGHEAHAHRFRRPPRVRGSHVKSRNAAAVRSRRPRSARPTQSFASP